MQANKEIEALLQLLDDPDQEVFQEISKRILSLGKNIIPNLEGYWEHSRNNDVQKKIEHIIQHIQHNELENLFKDWVSAEKPSLTMGAILLAKFIFPEVDEASIRKSLKNIYQSCWLELYQYLTPLEEAQIINSIFFNMFKFQSFEIDENKPNHFYINQVLETRHGNPYSIGLIYQIICELLDIPIYTIQLPKQFLLAYIKTTEIDQTPNKKNIQFYIDPNSGTIYSQIDIDAYLKKYDFVIDENHFIPLNAKHALLSNIEALAFVYEQLNMLDKVDSLKKIIALFYS
ncbi:MAG: transglutaminase family protein [Chitinophagaceae bacterium]